MMKRFFYHSILSLFLLVMFCITGGGNLAKAQSYQLVTSKDGLVSGDKYLIVSKDKGDALSTEQKTINRGAQAVSIVQNGSSIDAATLNSNVAIIVLTEEGTDLWSFQVTNGSNTGYLYAAGTKSKPNQLLTNTSTSGLDYRATISIATTGEATIVFENQKNTSGLSRTLQRNTSSALYSCYASAGQSPVYLYHYVEPAGATEPKLSYNPASDVVLSSNIAGWSAPTLTSEVIEDLSSLSFTYSSDKESVATVNSAGGITLTGTAGEAVISAKFDGDATYAPQTPTYKVNVFDPVTLDKEAGTYDNEVTVTLSAAGAQGIVYTTDGTEPTLNNGTKVEATSKELTFNETTTLKAISYYGETLSDVASAVYTIQKVLAVPTITPEGGTFNYEKKVTIASPGVAAIVYTLDGTDPKDLGAGAEMIDGDSKEITITSSCTLKARTSDANLGQFSDGLATADFIINLPQPVIRLSAESTQEQPITVTIEAEGASHIYYSTDGTDPTETSNSVVEVDAATTEFTLSEIGSYEIKAIALNSALDVSDAATRTCTISKVVPVPGSATMKYKKVTSMDDIVDGGVYLLACPSKNVIMSDKATGYNYTAYATYEFSGNEDLITDIKDLNVSGGPCEITLEKVADKANTYYIRYANGGQYLYNTSKTSLSFSDEINVNNLTQYQWTISITSHEVIDGGPVDAIQIQNNKNNTRSLDYSYANPRYAVYQYQPSQNAPSFLYKKTFDLSVNANTAGYATAYTAFPYVMPAGADGYIITETAEGETIKAKNKYPAGTEVPAYAPLLIKNAEAGVTLNPVVLGKTVEAYPYADENLLHGTRLESDGVTTDVDGTGTKTDDYYYYKLSYKLEAGNPVADSYGFYRGKADGSAFAMKNTLTAYLALPRSSGLVNNLRISIDNEDGSAMSIQTNRLPADNMPQSVYTLSGVRVNAAGNRLPKGIYIVNGKKVVIK